MTGLLAGQQRALNRMEKTLAAGDLRLGPLFAIFTRLAIHEPMPATERITDLPHRWRRVRVSPAAVTVAVLAMIIAALLMLSLSLPRPQECPGTVTAVSAHARSAAIGPERACTTRQAGPVGFQDR
jgi:hypothetical protein